MLSQALNIDYLSMQLPFLQALGIKLGGQPRGASAPPRA